MKRWVFNPALNCPRLTDDERSCDGSAFQTVAGAATDFVISNEYSIDYYIHRNL